MTCLPLASSNIRPQPLHWTDARVSLAHGLRRRSCSKRPGLTPRDCMTTAMPRTFADFLVTCRDELSREVLRRLPPPYQMDGARWAPALDRLSRQPFRVQFHAAAAIATTLYAHRSALLVCEPSVGKTIMALTAGAMIGAKRVLVLAPAYLLAGRANQANHSGCPGHRDPAAAGFRTGRHQTRRARTHRCSTCCPGTKPNSARPGTTPLNPVTCLTCAFPAPADRRGLAP